MKRPTLAIDFDDVLADSTNSMRKVVNDKYGASLSLAHYKVPGDYHKYYEGVWRTHGIHDKVSKEELDRQMVVDQSHVTPHHNAPQVLKQLSRRYELVIITARDERWKQATEQWVQLYFPDTFSGIYFGGQHDDPDQKTKGMLAAEVAANWLIDDNIDHCRSAIDNNVQAILFGEYGWQTNIPDDMKRCKSWQEVGKFLDEN